MPGRFKHLQPDKVQSKVLSKKPVEDSENLFRKSNNNESTPYARRETGKSLKELTNNNDRGRYDRGKGERNGNEHEINNRQNTFNKLALPVEKIVKEFKIDEQIFPELVEGLKINEIKKEDYMDKVNHIKEIKKIEESKVPSGWKILTKNMSNNKVNKNKVEISKYYNLKGAYLILENRELYREELNDILGDISPYWDMSYLDTFDYDDSEYYDTDESESDIEYLED